MPKQHMGCFCVALNPKVSETHLIVEMPSQEKNYW